MRGPRGWSPLTASLYALESFLFTMVGVVASDRLLDGFRIGRQGLVGLAIAFVIVDWASSMAAARAHARQEPAKTMGAGCLGIVFSPIALGSLALASSAVEFEGVLAFLATSAIVVASRFVSVSWLWRRVSGLPTVERDAAPRSRDVLPDLGSLEAVARDVAAEWGVELGEPFALARYSFVAPAGDDAVLKVTPLEDDEADEEADALALWDGNGAVRLLQHDRERRALLLERAGPLELRGCWSDKKATVIAVDVAKRLWMPASAPRFRSIHDHVPRWLENAREHPLAPLARELYASLDRRDDTLVHGDFHHHNILRSERGWLAIDPKPMLGEPEYDVASFLWNPLSYRMRLDVTEQRLAAFAAAGLDEGRMRAWAVIRGAYLGADPDEVEVLLALL